MSIRPLAGSVTAGVSDGLLPLWIPLAAPEGAAGSEHVCCLLSALKGLRQRASPRRRGQFPELETRHGDTSPVRQLPGFETRITLFCQMTLQS